MCHKQDGHADALARIRPYQIDTFRIRITLGVVKWSGMVLTQKQHEAQARFGLAEAQQYLLRIRSLM